MQAGRSGHQSQFSPLTADGGMLVTVPAGGDYSPQFQMQPPYEDPGHPALAVGLGFARPRIVGLGREGLRAG